MKRILFALLALSLSAFACNLNSATPTVTNPAVPPTVTSSFPTDTPPAPAANVTCNELSFYLDNLVAFNYACNTVPARLTGIGAHPQYTQVTLSTYQIGSNVNPEIDVFSAQAYLDAFPPDGISGFTTPLQALIAGGAPGTNLPYLNPYESAQFFHAQYRVLTTPSTSGIRYLTQSAQNYAVVNNFDMFYTYQGITPDGLYVVTAILPAGNALLPNHGDTYPGGETFQQFSDGFNAYIADTTSKLDSANPASFSPELSLLDGLVASIQVKP